MNDFIKQQTIDSVATDAGARQYLQRLAQFILRNGSESDWMSRDTLFERTRDSGVVVKNRPLGRDAWSKLIKKMIDLRAELRLDSYLIERGWQSVLSKSGNYIDKPHYKFSTLVSNPGQLSNL